MYGVEEGCTAGAYVHDTHGVGWITAQHTVGTDNSESSAIGTIVNLLEDEQNISSNTIGEVKDAFHQTSPSEIDVAYILRTVSNRDPHSWIANNSYTDNEGHDVVGVVTDTTLALNAVDSSWEVEVQGKETCQSTSSDHDLVYNGNTNLVGIKLDSHYTEPGDSGGPYFHVSGGDAYICGVHVGETKDGFSYGNTAETVENRLNGNWLTQ